MVYQTDPDFIEEVQEYGCLFLSLAYWKTKKHGKEWSYKELNSIWVMAKNQGFINEKCEIVDYTGVMSLLGITDLRYLNKHSPLQELDASHYGITKWYNNNTDYSHFVVGSSKPVEYDPYSAKGSKTVREGYPVDMRLFEVVV